MSDEELVAWVDENEKLIQVITKDLANSDPKYLHIEVVVLIVDSQGRALLQQRSKTKKVKPGVWTVAAAGHVTYGDTIEASALRELEEEMGITDIRLIPTFIENVTLPNERHSAHWFIGRYNRGEITTQKDEVDDYTWVSKEEFEQFCHSHDVSPRTVKVLARFWAGEWDHLIK